MQSKKDYYEYARNVAARYRSNNGSQDNNTSFNGRDETSGDNVWRTDESDDTSTSESERSTGFIFNSVEGVQRSSKITFGNEQSEYGTTDSSNGSDFTSIDGARSDSGPLRNLDGSIYQSPTGISRSTRTVTRKSILDDGVQKVTKFFQKNAPQKSSQKIINAPRKQGGLLTIGEVTKNRPLLIKMILVSSEHLDHGITAITRGHKEVEIWSNLEQPDAEILADAFQDAGQKSVWVAEKVRTVMKYYSKFQVGIILAPRIYKTVMYTVLTGIDIRL